MRVAAETLARLRTIAENGPETPRRVPRTRRVGWRGSQSVRNDEGMQTPCGRCPHVKVRHRLDDETSDGYCMECACPGYIEAVAS
jgi:hypothetical protein